MELPNAKEAKIKVQENLPPEAPRKLKLVIAPRSPADFGKSKSPDIDLPIALKGKLVMSSPSYLENFLLSGSASRISYFTFKVDSAETPMIIHKVLEVPKCKGIHGRNEGLGKTKKNETRELTDLPRGKRPVGCKWPFTLKYKADGTTEQYKACLFAKGPIAVAAAITSSCDYGLPGCITLQLCATMTVMQQFKTLVVAINLVNKFTSTRKSESVHCQCFKPKGPFAPEDVLEGLLPSKNTNGQTYNLSMF
ncbi:hypothetical protein CR513_31379, partial [Mucuna pruriens]